MKHGYRLEKLLYPLKHLLLSCIFIILMIHIILIILIILYWLHDVVVGIGVALNETADAIVGLE